MHIETANLKRAFESVRHVAESGATISALAGQVRLYTPEGGRLVLTARDDAMEAADALPCEGEALDVCLPATRISSVLMAAGEAISIYKKDGKVIAKSGKSRHTIACLPGGELPSIALEGEVRIALKAPDLAKTLASVHWAAAKGDLARPYLNGIEISASADGLDATASNGGMLATHCCDVESISGPETKFKEVISNAAVQRVIAMAPERIEVRRGVMRFIRGDHALTVRTLVSPYPDWRGLIPKHTGSIRVSRAEFLVAVAAAASYDDADKVRDKKMRSAVLRSDGTRLIVYSPSQNEGCRYEIEASGSEIEAAYPASSLAKALGESNAEEVELLFAPRGVLRINEGEWRFVLMPMKL